MTDMLPALDPLLLMIGAGWTAALLLHAALAKLADRSLFHQHIAAYGVPEALQPALVWALPLAECVAALGLVTPWRGAAALLAAALLGLYAAAMGWHLAQGRVLDCGCGGAPLPLSGWLVARNAVLAAVALATGLPAAVRDLSIADVAVAAAAVLLGTLLYAAAMGWHLAQGRVLDCGCGGAPLPLSGWLVARNGLLALVALAAGLPAAGRDLSIADVAVAAAAVLLGTLLYAALHQVLRQQPARRTSSSSNSGRSPA